MLIDNRKPWIYKGCEIIPIAVIRDAHWGKEAEPRDFGFGPRNRYWCVNCPDKTHCFAMTKNDCKAVVHRWLKNDVLIGQATLFMDQKDFDRAEKLLDILESENKDHHPTITKLRNEISIRKGK